MRQPSVLYERHRFPGEVISHGVWLYYRFRASTYRASMQQRLESLPPTKSVLVLSDGRCIEWCFGKLLLVEHLLAEVLQEQIERGWPSRGHALWVASEWLYGPPPATTAPWREGPPS